MLQVQVSCCVNAGTLPLRQWAGLKLQEIQLGNNLLEVRHLLQSNSNDCCIISYQACALYAG